MLPAEVIGIVAALAAAGWPLRRLGRQVALPPGVLPSIVLLFLGQLLLDVVALALDGYDDPVPPAFERILHTLFGAHEAVSIVLIFVMLVVVTPVVEELLVRGILLRALAINWGPTAGVVVTAVVFTLLHGNLGQIRYAWLPGLVFAIVVLLTGSLGVAMVLHALTNLTGFGFLLGFGLAGVHADASLPSLPPAVAAGGALAGLLLLTAGVRRLPADPARLAFLWGVPLGDARSVGELCRALRTRRRAARAAAAPPVSPPPAPAPPAVAAAIADDSVAGDVRCGVCGTFRPRALLVLRRGARDRGSLADQRPLTVCSERPSKDPSSSPAHVVPPR